jgi:ferric-dicitrate binding protein FerR (iron transport regulator)
LVIYVLMGNRERIKEKAFATAVGAAAAVVVVWPSFTPSRTGWPGDTHTRNGEPRSK